MRSSGIDRIRTRIDAMRREKAIGIMTHTVAGYPTLPACERAVTTMDSHGADFIELQIPFSDPVADGPVILNANHKALDAGMTVRRCFSFARRIHASVSAPLLFITYANIPFTYGIDAFCRDAAASGAAGIIVPDLPYDDAEGLYEAALRHGISAVPVISEVTSAERISAIDRIATGFIYVTSRLWVTGGSGMRAGITDFLDKARSITEKPLAVGFGIRRTADVSTLVSHADIAVIGSHLLTLAGGKAGGSRMASFLDSVHLPLQKK